jgi:hypothetical protein
MIQGLPFVIALILRVAALIISVILHLRTDWRASTVGKQLMAFFIVELLWWALVLYGSFTGGPSLFIQLSQGFAFLATTIVIVSFTLIQVKFALEYRRENGRRKSGHAN